MMKLEDILSMANSLGLSKQPTDFDEHYYSERQATLRATNFAEGAGSFAFDADDSDIHL